MCTVCIALRPMTVDCSGVSGSASIASKSSSRWCGSSSACARSVRNAVLAVTGSGHQVLDLLPRRRVALEQRDVSQQGNGVVVEDPVVLRSDERRDRRRGRPAEDGGAISADGLEVVEQPVVVVLLLVDVLLEVAHELGRDRVVLCHALRPFARGLHQRDAGADVAVRREEVLGIELADARIVYETAPCVQVGRKQELDLTT